MTTSRVLVVVRHSKAEPGGPTDFERQLADRGRADARATGAWLAEQGVVADQALVSAALRTRQTWEELAPAAGWGLAPDYEDELYGADEYDAIARIAAVDEAVRTLVVIGHNPTMHSLAAVLDDGEGPAEARSRLASGYPTSAAGVFDIAVPWGDVGPGVGTLRALYVGRG